MPLKRKILFHFLAPSSSYHPAVIFLCQSASCRISSSLAPRRPRPSGKSASIFFFHLPICQLLHMRTVSLPACQLLHTLCRMLPVFPPVFLLPRTPYRMQMPAPLPFFCSIQTDSKVTYSVPPFFVVKRLPVCIFIVLPEAGRKKYALIYYLVTFL